MNGPTTSGQDLEALHQHALNLGISTGQLKAVIVRVGNDPVKVEAAARRIAASVASRSEQDLR